MEQRKYFCDKCKKEVKNRDDLMTIEIGWRRSSGSSYNFIHDIKLDLCDLCLEKLGMIKRVIDGDNIKNEPQDIKDRLYDLAVDLCEEIGIQIEY